MVRTEGKSWSLVTFFLPILWKNVTHNCLLQSFVNHIVSWKTSQKKNPTSNYLHKLHFSAKVRSLHLIMTHLPLNKSLILCKIGRQYIFLRTWPEQFQLLNISCECLLSFLFHLNEKHQKKVASQYSTISNFLFSSFWCFPLYFCFSFSICQKNLFSVRCWHTYFFPSSKIFMQQKLQQMGSSS